MDEFIKAWSWFDWEYRILDVLRFTTMKASLNLFRQYNGKTIVETGTTRFPNDWGAGMSTLLFGHYCHKYGGKVTTVDIEQGAIDVCRQVTEKFASAIDYVLSDSIVFLNNYKGPKIDLLYLDSYDYPFGVLLNDFGGSEHLVEAEYKMLRTPFEDIWTKYGDVILPCQEFQLSEFKLAEKHLSEHAVVLLDDNELPGGGKTRLTKEYLITKPEWKLVLDLQQSLWVKI
jgi:hypothetical protein